MASKLRVEQLETLDGQHTKNVSDLLVDIDHATVVTSTGDQTLAESLESRVIYVDTLDDLQALGTSGLLAGQQVSVADAGMYKWDGSSFDEVANYNPTDPTAESIPFHADGASSPTNLGDILQAGFVNVASFGATGASQDYTSELQAALDSGVGRTVYVPAGTYHLTGILRIGSNTTLLLDPGATMLRKGSQNLMLTNDSDGTVGGWGANRNIRIIGGLWDCNAREFSASATTMGFGHCSWVRVENLEVRDVSGRWHAIELNACEHSYIINCRFDSGGNNQSHGECIQLDIALSSPGFPWFGPYDGTPCRRVGVFNCHILNWATGVGSHSSSSDASQRNEGIVIDSNVISVSKRGVSAHGWSGVRITNNRIQGSLIGIAVEHGNSTNNSDYVISGNTFYPMSTPEGASDGRCILMRGTSGESFHTLYKIHITNNNFWTPFSHTVGLDYCRDVSVSGNWFGAGGTGKTGTNSLYIYGTSRTTVTGNLFDGDIMFISAGGSSCEKNAFSGNTVNGELTIDTTAERSVVTGNRIQTMTDRSPSSTTVVGNSVG